MMVKASELHRTDDDHDLASKRQQQTHYQRFPGGALSQIIRILLLNVEFYGKPEHL